MDDIRKLFHKIKRKLEDKTVIESDSDINKVMSDKLHDKKSVIHKFKSFSAKDFAHQFGRFDKKRKKRPLNQLLAEFLTKTGYDETPREVHKKIILFDIKIMALVSVTLLIIGIINKTSINVLLTFLLMIWTVLLIACYLASFLVVMLYLDIRMFKRIKQIEEALPDFLQLTAANISAGMTVDRALWLAVRPRFGVLADEIEDVAKSTLAGEDLEKALTKFANKYDSKVLKESLNLLVAGLSSGGEMAVLLNKIATNIKETGLIKKEVAASVMTYVIFIGAATIVAAPILFALSTELLTIIKQITSAINIDKTSGVGGAFSFNFSGNSISIENFKKFAMLVLVTSSFFSAAITSTIRKGSIKDGIKMIPIFIAISLILYFLFVAIFGSLMGGFFVNLK